jgi:hypothetical protein
MLIAAVAMLTSAWPRIAAAASEPDASPSSRSLAEPPSALEVSASLGPSVAFGEPANPQYTQSFGRVGVSLSAALAYRSSYFIDPFFEVGYALLASGESTLPVGPWGQGGDLSHSLGTWIFSPGIRTELWRFRPELGLGLAIVTQSNDFAGETNHVTQPALLTQVGLGFSLVEAERIHIDTGLKLVTAQGAGISFVCLSLIARLDALAFNGH